MNIKNMSIQGLRGYAVLFVVIFHLFNKVLPGGFIGVDLFFVISGYLMTKQIFGIDSFKNFDFINFYFSRIRKILPPLLIILNFSLIVGLIFLNINDFINLNQHIFYACFFSTNTLLVKEAGYFDYSSLKKPLLHLWSLSLEFNFYLICPFIFINSKKKLIIFNLFIFSFILNCYFLYVNEINSYYFFSSRIFEFLVGYYAFIYTINQNKYSLKYQKTKFFIGILLITISLFYINSKSFFPGIVILIPLAGFFILIVNNTENIFNKIILQNKIIIFIGFISYPLYLWHWIIHSFYLIITNQNEFNFIVSACIFIVSIFLSALTTLYIEIPFSKIKITSFYK